MASTAAPLRASAASARRISVAAPTSTPQVGWLTASTPGWRSSSRPTTNFWRLPPESALASGSPSGARTSKRSTMRRARPRARERCRRPPVASSWSVPCRVRTAFSERRMPGTAAWPSRSSGMKAAPRRLRLRGPIRPQARPSISTAASSEAGVSPESAANSSSCPLPATPATPTISPPHTSSEMSSSEMPKGVSASSERPRTASRTGPAAAGWPSCLPTPSTSAPTISRARSAMLAVFGSGRPTTRPCRSTVALWQSWRTSSSRWLI